MLPGLCPVIFRASSCSIFTALLDGAVCCRVSSLQKINALTSALRACICSCRGQRTCSARCAPVFVFAGGKQTCSARCAPAFVLAVGKQTCSARCAPVFVFAVGKQTSLARCALAFVFCLGQTNLIRASEALAHAFALGELLDSDLALNKGRPLILTYGTSPLCRCFPWGLVMRTTLDGCSSAAACWESPFRTCGCF